MPALRIRISRKHVLITASVTLAAALAVVFSLNAMARRHRAEVQQELKKLLGSDATFDHLSARFWDGFAFSVTEFRITDDPRFAATPFLKAEELRLGMSWWRLLLGHFVINSLTFTRPELQIITNEDGLMNVSALAERKKNLLAFSRARAGALDKRTTGLTFLLTRVKVIDGRIDFIDRSISAPAELQIKKVDLEIGGIGVAPRARIDLAASIAATVRQDVHIRGEIGPPLLGKDWAQQPVSLEMRFDSLYLPMLARAMPFFRDKIPREFDITGPMFFETKMAGTLEQPRFTNVTLKVPFLGSSEYNAVLQGRVALDRDHDWSEAPMGGTLTLNAVSLAQLRKLPVMRQLLPDDLAISGSVDVRSRFEGSWNRLRVGALLDVRGSEMRYRKWLVKPAGEQAQVRAQVTGHQAGYQLHPSEIDLGELKALVSGALLTDGPNPQLTVRVRTDDAPVRALAPFLAPDFVSPGIGEIDCNLVLERGLDPASDWRLEGALHLDQVEVRHKASARKLDRLSGSVFFSGRRARADYVSFRLGSSPASASFAASEINPLRLRYSLRAEHLVLADLPVAPKPLGEMFAVVSQGELALEELPRVTGVVTSSAGSLSGASYRDLKTDLAWSPAELTFKNLRMTAFNGALHSSAALKLNPGGEAAALSFVPGAEALSLNEVLTWLAPGQKDRFHGRLDFAGQFSATVLGDSAPWQMLRGSGAAVVRNGTIKNFNLLARLFYRSGAEAESGRTPRGLQALLARTDTQVQELRAETILEQERVRADNLSLETSEYTISGSGWVGFDGTTQCSGMLTFSPAVSRELQGEYGAIRYFLDRKGRLAISFRVDGRLPNVRLRPDNRALAQALRWGASQRADDLTGPQGRSGRKWLPDSLERLLHR
jgi:hypothetical protein